MNWKELAEMPNGTILLWKDKDFEYRNVYVKVSNSEIKIVNDTALDIEDATWKEGNIEISTNHTRRTVKIYV